ncbi:ABC transporter permease [Wenjunlia vitaminophila]|uniref:ABC transporter permease n=1 Tax=Wenjunlia vitaminophila TaxID=76728 RepID=A0A0T6LTD4_WENVI|nr:ABC transporter permease [Wenjunlia vitaminophila]KRV49268.1 ABC transporter permease [Wenjunlia vitaminophila]
MSWGSTTAPRAVPSGLARRARPLAVGTASLAAGVLLWQLVVTLFDVPDYKLPSPGQVADRGWELGRDGVLTPHIQQTLAEVTQGVLLGSVIGVVLAALFVRVRLVERLLMPLIVVAQVTPKISIAPLIVLWLGLGVGSKIALVTLVSFYPVLVNTVMRLRSIPKGVDDLSRILKLGPVARAIKIDLPYSLPAIAAGLRLGTLAAVTAAVIGEFIGAQSGLGYLERQAQENDDIQLVIVSLLLLCLLALALYALVNLLERIIRTRFGEE